MQKDGYMNISAKLGSDEINLGWITGITAWRTPRAVFMSAHSHPNIELLFCFKGNLVYEIEGYGSVSVSEGTGIVIPANTRHALRDDTDSPCDRLGMHISSRMARSRKFGVFSPDDYRDIYSTLEASAAKAFRLDTKLLSLLKELAALTYDGIGKSPAYGYLRAICCAIIYRTAETLQNPVVSPGPQMMELAVRFLEENHTKKIGIEDLVKRMGYGRTRLFHLFKRHTGLTPNEYLVRHRIGKAGELIRKRELPISKIAAATGFSSETYFRAVFLKYTGHTPESFE